MIEKNLRRVNLVLNPAIKRPEVTRVGDRERVFPFESSDHMVVLLSYIQTQITNGKSLTIKCDFTGPGINRVIVDTFDWKRELIKGIS
jgi:hypothetical protein